MCWDVRGVRGIGLGIFKLLGYFWKAGQGRDVDI